MQDNAQKRIKITNIKYAPLASPRANDAKIIRFGIIKIYRLMRNLPEHALSRLSFMNPKKPCRNNTLWQMPKNTEQYCYFRSKRWQGYNGCTGCSKPAYCVKTSTATSAMFSFSLTSAAICPLPFTESKMRRLRCFIYACTRSLSMLS